MGSRALVLFVLLAACARTTMQSSAVEGSGDELDFWDRLASRRAVTNDEALHALLLHAGLGDRSANYDARLAVARERGWVDEDLPPLETARVGWIAMAVCIEHGIEGGVTMRVFGPSRRYAVRELNWRGWLPDMTPGQAISGLTLVALLSKAEDSA